MCAHQGRHSSRNQTDEERDSEPGREKLCRVNANGLERADAERKQGSAAVASIHANGRRTGVWHHHQRRGAEPDSGAERLDHSSSGLLSASGEQIGIWPGTENAASAVEIAVLHSARVVPRSGDSTPGSDEGDDQSLMSVAHNSTCPFGDHEIVGETTFRGEKKFVMCHGPVA